MLNVSIKIKDIENRLLAGEELSTEDLFYLEEVLEIDLSDLL
jgi:uncharacterized coiled-coil DUF342 family protein